MKLHAKLSLSLLLTVLMFFCICITIPVNAVEADYSTVAVDSADEATTEPTSPAEPTKVFGDVNGDRIINSKDTTLIHKTVALYDVDIKDEVKQNLTSYADLNCDGKVSIADVTLYQMYISGMIFDLPYIDDTEVIDTTLAKFPKYWNNEVLDTMRKVRNNRKQSENLAEFVYLTDWHWNTNMHYSPALVNYITGRTGIKNVILGGDSITYYNPNKSAAIEEASSIYNELNPDLNLFTTLGNHDRNGSSGNTNVSIMITDEEAYNLYIKRQESFAVTEKGNPNYSYFDDKNLKLRVVQFYMSDSFFLGMKEERGGKAVQEAKEWAISKMKELPKDWTVILITHAYYRMHPDSGDSLTLSNINIGIKDDILKAKSEMKATLAAWIVGHSHFDYDEILKSTDKNNAETLQLIVTQCDAKHQSNVNYGQKMYINTSTEQAFDIVQIDTKKREIRLTRCGAGDDRRFSY